MPSSWRDDPRFRCPNCNAQISLRAIKEGSDLRRLTKSSMVATCRICGRAYTIEEWRQYADRDDRRNDLAS